MVKRMKTRECETSETLASSDYEESCPIEKHIVLPEIDEEALRETAKLHKALSDETRLKILLFLQEGELCVCEIVEALGKPQSTVSHHLFLLQNAGLIKVRKKGRWNMYSLSDTARALSDCLLKVGL